MEERAEADMFPRACLQSVTRSTQLPDRVPVGGNLNGTCVVRHRPAANQLLASASLFFFNVAGLADQSATAPSRMTRRPTVFGKYFRLSFVVS